MEERRTNYFLNTTDLTESHHLSHTTKYNLIINMFLEKYRDVPASDTEKGTLEQKHNEPSRTVRDVGRNKKQC